MPPPKLAFIRADLDALAESNLLITIRTIASPADAWMVVDGKRVLNFCTNNYLGLANHPRLKQAAREAVERWGVGPAAVRTIAGTTSLHLELERRLAAFKGVEDALFVQSGFNANQAAIASLVGKEDVIFSDRLNHASIIDGSRLSGAKIVVYEHCDPADAETKIAETPAPLPSRPADHRWRLQHGWRHRPARQAVRGRRAPRRADDGGRRPRRGRAGPRRPRHRRSLRPARTHRHRNRHPIESLRRDRRRHRWQKTHHRLPPPESPALPLLLAPPPLPTPPPAWPQSILLEESEDRVQRLWENAHYLREEMQRLGFDTGHSQTPILPIMLGDAGLAKEFSRRLFEEGVFAMSIGFPTVPQGLARIRVMNTAAHTRADLDFGLQAFAKVGRALGVIA